MRVRLAVFISIIQSILFLGHLFVYFTWSAFWGAGVSGWVVKTGLTLGSMIFVAASLRSWYAHDFLSRTFYKISALWLGLASNLLWASVLCWVVGGITWLARLAWPRPTIADVVFAAAALAFIAGLINGAWLRVTRVKITLPSLPQEWRGRTAVLASDLHLGPVRNGRFARRVVDKIAALQPNIVFLAGDLYDGTAANFEKLAEPWAEFVAARNLQNNEPPVSSARVRLPSALHRHAVTEGSAIAVLDAPPGPETTDAGRKFLGVFAIPGNHEEFYRHAEYLGPLVQAGVRCLDNEKVEVDGLQVLGVNYRDAADPERYRMVLDSLGLDPARASVLLLHAPVQLPVSEAAGISLHLAGHTHGGQFFPGTWIANRVWGKFVHGLQRLGNLQVFTSYGAGTWGPPLRLGTRPEIVLIEFQSSLHNP